MRRANKKGPPLTRPVEPSVVARRKRRACASRKFHSVMGSAHRLFGFVGFRERRARSESRVETHVRQLNAQMRASSEFPLKTATSVS